MISNKKWRNIGCATSRKVSRRDSRCRRKLLSVREEIRIARINFVAIDQDTRLWTHRESISRIRSAILTSTEGAGHCPSSAGTRALIMTGCSRKNEHGSSRGATRRRRTFPLTIPSDWVPESQIDCPRQEKTA